MSFRTENNIRQYTTSVVSEYTKPEAGLKGSVNTKYSLEIEDPMIAKYSFDDLSSPGDNSHNSGTYAGTLTGTTSASGVFGGYSRRFNGTSSDYILIPDMQELHIGSSAFSVSLWVKPDLLKTQYFLTNKSSSGTASSGIHLGALADGSVQYIHGNGTSIIHTMDGTSAGSIVAGSWQHLAVTFDGTLNSKSIKVYVNGNIVDTGSVSQLQTIDTQYGMYLGTRPNLLDQNYDGDMDDLRFFNRELSSDEILSLYRPGIKTIFDQNQVVSSYSLSGFVEATIAVAEGVAAPESFTSYDGVDDSFYTSDSMLKIPGAQTWCCEVYVESVPTSYSKVLSNLKVASPRNGMELAINDSGNPRFLVSINNGGSGGSLVNVTDTDPIPTNSWVTLVGTMTPGGAVGVHVNGISQGTSSLATHGVSTVDFTIADTSDTSFFAPFGGNIRNIEIYSGEASNPAEWVPGDTTSLQGVNLVMRSPNGSGTDNQQGFSFNANGDPEIVSDLTIVPQSEVAGPLVFNGVDDEIEYASGEFYRPSGADDFSLSFWVKPYSRPSVNYDGMVSVVSGTGGSWSDIGYAVVHRTDGTIMFQMSNNGGSGMTIVGTQELTLNQWNHVFVSKNGSTKSLFVNNVADGTSTTTTSMPSNAWTTKIGHGYHQSNWLHGEISDLQILDSGLSGNKREFIYETEYRTKIESYVLDDASNYYVRPSGNIDLFEPYTTFPGGSGSYFSTSAPELKITGDQTWALEAFIPDPGAVNFGIMGNEDASGGVALFFTPITGGHAIGVHKNLEWMAISTTTLVPTGQWVKLVFVISDSNSQIIIDGVSASLSNNTTQPSVSVQDFTIGSAYINGAFDHPTVDISLRNVEIYSGVPTDATAWIPGDLTSLQGVTNVLALPNGSPE